jgi:LysM repeat protein
MEKRNVIGLVTGAHVIVIGSMLLSQGCGTTRAPLPPEETIVMPPSVPEETAVRPVPVEPVYRPAPMPPMQMPVEPVEADPVVVTPPTETTTYVVKKGDALSVIAKRYDVPLKEVMRINNISDPNMIRINQKLQLPGLINIDQPRPVQRGGSSSSSPAPAVDGSRYVVKAGDALSVIAQRAGVKTADLMRANHITDPNRIQVGQELVIPGGGRVEAPAPADPVAPVIPTAPEVPSFSMPDEAAVEDDVMDATSSEDLGGLPPAPGPQGTAQTHVVEIGDDLLSVASEYNVSIADLRAANNLDSDILVPGRTLIIPSVD